MPIRPIPTPSLILSDPGDLPIIPTSSLNYYRAGKYSCSRTVCGQFIGNETIVSGTPLTIGRFYTSDNLPGFVFQASSITTGTAGVGINPTSYSSCNSACASAFTILPTPPSSISITPSPTRTPTNTVTPSPTATVGTSPTPTRTPSVTPSVTRTPSVTPSITPSITATPSQTPFPSPQFGIYVTCSFQILDTVPTCSVATSNLTGSITGSLSSSVATTGIFIPSSSFQTSMVNFFPIAFTTYTQGAMIGVPIGPSQPGGNIGYQLNPDRLVVANNTVVTSSFLTYYPEPVPTPPEGIYMPIVDFSNNVTLYAYYVVNRFGVNDIDFFTLRIRVYKNTYLIYNDTRTHYNKSKFGSTGYGLGVGYSEPYVFTIPYGTICNNDDIEIVYSLA